MIVFWHTVVEAQVAVDNRAAGVVREVAGARSSPVSQVAQDYPQAMIELLRLQTVQSKVFGTEQNKNRGKEAVRRQARLLAECGTSRADAIELYGWDGLLARLLSLKETRGIGIRQDDGFHALYAAMDFDGLSRPEAPLLLAAAKAFKTPITMEQYRRCSAWRNKIAGSLKSNGVMCHRDTKLDRPLRLNSRHDALRPDLRALTQLCDHGSRTACSHCVSYHDALGQLTCLRHLHWMLPALSKYGNAGEQHQSRLCDRAERHSTSGTKTAA